MEAPKFDESTTVDDLRSATANGEDRLARRLDALRSQGAVLAQRGHTTRTARPERGRSERRAM
jgi:hypothetical protein